MTECSTELKIGDKVRITQRANRWGQICPPDDYIGAVGTITDIAIDGISVKFDGKQSLAFYAHQLAPAHL